MSDELVQKTYRAYDAFARRDFDALAALWGAFTCRGWRRARATSSPRGS